MILTKPFKNPLNKSLSSVVNFFFLIYRVFFRPVFGCSCHFQPTCSRYCKEAFLSHNLFYALYLTVYRLLRCHPLNSGGYDPVPRRSEVL